MSREFNDDCDGEGNIELWCQALHNALNGRRGQKFLREVETEMLAMKERGEGRLVSGYLIATGPEANVQPPLGNEFYRKPIPPVGVCAIGTVLRKKTAPEIAHSINRHMESPYDFPNWLPKVLDVPQCLLAEIGANNDENRDRQIFDEHGKFKAMTQETEEQRFERMLKWVQARISRNGEKVRR